MSDDYVTYSEIADLAIRDAAEREIVLVADCYLSGAGVEQSVKTGRRSRRVLVLTIDGERIVLQPRG